jgi:UDP-glucuronate decarboxylase
MSKYSSIISEDVESISRRLGTLTSKLNGATLLVTGASGFLCSYFLETVAYLNERVLASPCRVVAIDKTFDSERLAHLRGNSAFRFIEHDASIPLEIDEKVDWVIHGASIASPTFYRRFPLETIDVNVTGTRQMLELARRHDAKGLLFISTSEVYGDPDPAFIPTAEDYRGNVSCTGPRACYDESKRLGETLCMTYHRLYKTPVKIVRPFNVYGPGQSLADRRIIPDLMSSAIDRRPITLLSDGGATRAFCYVTDAITAIWHVLLSGSGGEIFNIGNDEGEVSIIEVAERLAEVAGPPHLIIQRRESEDADYVTDNPSRRCPDLTRLRSMFDWSPEVSLTQGLDRTLCSYLEICPGQVPLETPVSSLGILA